MIKTTPPEKSLHQVARHLYTFRGTTKIMNGFSIFLYRFGVFYECGRTLIAFIERLVHRAFICGDREHDSQVFLCVFLPKMYNFINMANSFSNFIGMYNISIFEFSIFYQFTVISVEILIIFIRRKLSVFLKIRKKPKICICSKLNLALLWNTGKQ